MIPDSRSRRPASVTDAVDLLSRPRRGISGLWPASDDLGSDDEASARHPPPHLIDLHGIAALEVISRGRTATIWSSARSPPSTSC